MSDERLCAYLDDELSPNDRDAVETELSSSARLRRELAELEATRSLVRGLPMLDLPAGVTQRVRPAATGGLASQTGSNRFGYRRIGVAIAAVAAAWLLILSVGVSLGSLPIVPEVDQLAVQHAAAESGDEMSFAEMDSESMMKKDAAIMADIGHGMGLDAVFQRDDVVHARYSDGEHAVSVFHEPGEVDWDDLPASGEIEVLPTGKVWRSSMKGVEVLVVQRGDLVVTIVVDGDMDEDMATAASEMVPQVDEDPSWWDRLKAAPGNIFDRF
ncbi:MAG: anti-sigma factor family protein [Acidimicrobiales bacterium]